jgi:hypothetical protein
MNKMAQSSRRDLRALTLCGAALAFFLLGGLRAQVDRNDFVPVYQGARCLLHGCNPYGTGELLYPPSTLLVLSPLAVFPYPVAWLLWFLLSGALFISAVVAVLSLCPDRHRWLATTLGAVLLAGSSLLLILGQPSAFSVSLLAIGTTLFLKGRNLPLGAVLVTLSLAVKPQMGALVVLYLFLRGIHRRYAALSMVGAFALLLCGGFILKMDPQSADWRASLKSNVSRAVTPGATDDPRPANEHAAAALNLQTVTSVFFVDEKAFNDAAYGIFAVLFIVWGIAAFRISPKLDNHLQSIAAVTVLTLMPVYHRNYDSRLLLLAIPGAVIAFGRRPVLGTAISILTALTTISLQHWVELSLVHHGLLHFVMNSKTLLILLLRESNIRLLVLYCLFVIALLDAPAPVEAGTDLDTKTLGRVREATA